MDTKLGMYAVVISVVIALAIIGAALINNPNIIPQLEKKTITSDGTYTTSVAPNKVEITFSIVTNGTTASAAQGSNSQISDKVIAALKAKGYTDKDISTVYYNVYPEYNWSGGTSDIIGYTATHQLKVNTSNISAAGSIVDIVVKNGANQVDYIDFGLTPDSENAYRVDALAKASQNARDKANAIATGLGLTIKGVTSVSEGNVYYPPYRLDYATAEASAGGASKTVQLTPGNVEVSATVSVTFELG
jgi:hypothetical protein